ncbi:hypothetical protein L5G28_16535 [Gordonia sp. HY285]|uniref:hypothetical protein n=1 Tax=Gordonia liuliyuniae TaxID=2911517 RepID=UPI001F1DED85|nr:hypothetical protein [Gordonia liuliyuniae]MCF8611755.1 hypothetical protein [Gordonia liuliyuniae]
MTYPMPPRGPQRSPWASPAVIVAIVIGVLVLIGGVTGALVYANSHSDETATAGSSSESSSPKPAQSGSTVTVTQQPQQGPTAQDPTPTTAPPPTTSHSSPTVSGADWQGFTGSSARCNADDAAVFVGYTDRSQVVVCQVGSQVGRNYYKGSADGGSIEIGYPTRSGNTFTAVNGGTTYEVSTSALVITPAGDGPHVESMIQAWVD